MANKNTLLEARKIIAGFFKQRRIELKLTQQALADKCGFHVNTVRNYEAAQFGLGFDQYITVCEALCLFPSISEIEADTPIAVALRQNWVQHPKSMSLEDAIALKSKQFKNSSDN